MADLVLRIDLAEEQLLDEEDLPDLHKVAAALKWAAERVANHSGAIWDLNGMPLRAKKNAQRTIGTLTFDHGADEDPPAWKVQPMAGTYREWWEVRRTTDSTLYAQDSDGGPVSRWPEAEARVLADHLNREAARK
jgi:hypothetical protein